MLLSAGADVNVRGSGGTGALTAATMCGHAEMVQFLLEAGYRPRRDDAIVVTDFIQRIGGKENAMLAVELLREIEQDDWH
jgi:hypothetical protein